MAVNDCFLVTVKANMNGQPVVNTIAFNAITGTGYSNATFQGIANAIKDALRGSQVNDLVYSDWRALKVRGDGVTYSTSPPFRVSTVAYAGALTGTVVGSITQPPLPNQICAVARVNTDEAGRRRKGRIFVAGLQEGDVDDNSFLASTYQTALQTGLNLIHAAYGPGGTNGNWEYGVWSDRTATGVTLSNTWPRERINVDPPSPDTAFASGVSLDVQPYVGSQRGRRPGI